MLSANLREQEYAECLSPCDFLCNEVCKGCISSTKVSWCEKWLVCRLSLHGNVSDSSSKDINNQYLI